MTIELIAIGKTDLGEVSSLFDIYAKRVSRYVKFSFTTLPDVRVSKKTAPAVVKRQEGEMLLRRIGDGDYVVLLDEQGEEMRSREFASWLDKRIAAGGKRICFIIGGAYGFSDDVYARSDSKLSLSKMTFSHQIIRAIFAEQLYRAFSIINNEPYHND